MAVAKRVFFVFMVLTILTSVYSITRGNTQQALAATPATLNFQARLMSSAGNLVPDGNYNIEFKLYNASTSSGSSQGSCTGDANCLWTETRTGGNQIQVKDGYLSAYLGDITALPSNIWDQQLWLTMNIGGTGIAVWDGEMTPRIRMTSVPYAFQAKSAETLNKNTGSFTGTVDFATMTADRKFLFPDTSLATTASPGTICVYNGAASNCPAASGSAYYIQNDNVAVQLQSNFYIQGRDDGVNGTVVGQFRGAANGQTVDLVQFQASNGTVLGAVTAAGNLQVASSIDTRTAGTLNIGTATASAINIGKTAITTTIEGALTVDESATFSDNVTIAAEKTIRFVGGTTVQRPLSPSEGTVYFDTDTKQLLIYANGKWQGDRSTATKIVAASDSAPAVKDSADFVATGTSDEDTINAALTAAAGGTVYIASGTYTIDGTILIPNNTKLVGNGDQSLIQLDVGAGNGTAISNLDTAPGSGGIVIRDIKVDGSLGTGGMQHGIRFDGLDSVNSEIASVRLTGWTNGSAIKLENTTGLSTLSRSYIEGDITLTGGSGIALMSSNMVFGDVSLNDSGINNITNNNISGGVTLAASSSILSMAANLAAGPLVINGSSAESIVGNYLGEVSINGSNDVTIEANRISLSGTDAIDLVNSNGTRIVNNRIVTNGGSGYSINITDAASSNTYIAGNDLAGLGINDLGTNTVIVGQVGPGGDFVVQPTGNIELLKDTHITGGLTVSGTSTFTGQATFDGGLRISDASSNYATITVGPLAGNYSVTIPTITANDTFCLVSLANCAYDGGDFIQNQNASAQTTANFWIDGTARADTSVLTPLLDTGTAVALNIGTTNATQINLNKNVVVAAGQSLTITGGNTGSRPAGSEGMLYYDTDTKQLLVFANGKWQADRSEAVLVAASNSSDADKAAADYVADGNGGSANDGDQVQINQALTAGSGKKVVLLAGTYVADATILIPNNTTLAGVGNGTVIELADLDATDNLVENSDTTTGTGVVVSDLILNGRRDLNSTGTQHGLVINGVGDNTTRVGPVVSRLVVRNFRDDGIRINNSFHGSVTGSTLYNNLVSGVDILGASSYITVSDNMAHDNTYGFAINGSLYNILNNNTAYNNSDSGFYLIGSANSNTLTGNVSRGNTTNGVLVTNSSNNVITGTSIRGTTTYGIQLSGSNNNNISNNMIYDTGGAGANNGVYVNNSNLNQITSNNIVDTAPASAVAITIAGTSDRNYIASNTISSTTVTGTISDADPDTVYGGQINGSGNYVIQPAGTVELMKNTNVTGNVSATTTNTYDLGTSSILWRTGYFGTSVLTPAVGRATAGTLSIGTDANSTAVSISRTGVTTTVYGALTVNEATQLSGGLTVTNGGNIAIQRNLTNYTATGTQDNVNFGTGALFRITSASAVTINGIAGGTDGRLITLMNASANTVTLGNSASGTAANNIVTGTGGSLVVPAGATVELAYDSTAPGTWRVIGSTATQGGAANQQLSNLSGTVAVNLGLVPAAAQDNAIDLGSASFGWRTVYADTSVITALVDAPSGTALNIGTTNATQINLNKNTQVTGNVTLAEGANRTLSVQTRTTAGGGYNLTVAGGSANGANNVGGSLSLQGGSAVAGNADGGGVFLSGGAGAGTGTQGLVFLATTAFSSYSQITYGSAGAQDLTAGKVDQYSTITVAASTTGVIVRVPDPAQSQSGRVLYIAARSGSSDFTLRLNNARTPIDIAMKQNSTATLIWNGSDWTAAGASSSTDLQSAYNNTLTSAGGAEIVLNPTGGAADGFTIRNNATTPISGGILEVQSSIGTNLFSVNNFGTELAANGGAETSSTFGTNWTGAPLGGSASRTTTAGQYVTGQAGVSASTTATSLTGIRNNLSGNPVNSIGAQYQVSFTAKSTVNGTQVQVDYSRNGGTNMTACATYGTDVNVDGVDDGFATLSDTGWTKVTCTITVDSATAATDPDLFIRKIGAGTPTIYIDNLSFMRNDTTTQPSNVQIGGGINGGPVTLFTLDRSSAPPVADGNTNYLGSMYYDTTTGRIQCYEADGWGACGSPPDNIITLTPEYTGAVLNGNGIGVLTADFCGDGVLNVEAVFCGTGEARNYYRWTSPQATDQTYSIYVNYKLPSTFKEFASANTMKITTRTDDLSLARADIEVFRKAASGGITSCGSHTTLNNALNQWQQKDYSGNEMSCGFQGSDYIIFKVTVHSSQSKNVYIENIDFTYLND